MLQKVSLHEYPPSGAMDRLDWLDAHHQIWDEQSDRAEAALRMMVRGAPWVIARAIRKALTEAGVEVQDSGAVAKTRSSRPSEDIPAEAALGHVIRDMLADGGDAPREAE